MSDKERNTCYDSLSETGSPPAGSDEKCPYCGIYKIMAESRLFEVPEAFGNEHGRCNSDSPRRMSCVEPIPYPRFKEGIYRCCRFCGLLADVITTQRQEADGYVSIVQWSLLLKGGQFLMVCHAQDELSFHSRMNISRGTGCQSQWNLQEQQVLGDTSCPEAVATARGWLEDCKDKHKHRKHESHAQKNPKRILKLDGEQIKLCENLEPATAYACLSHCWGPRGPAMQLRSDTMSNLKSGVPLDTLPKTFRDAAWFCWRLGIPYLWIDALCIIQGDEADWEEAAATMADVYESAEITISAGWSNSSEDGCFAPAETSNHAISLSENGLYLRESMLDFPRSYHTSNNDQWPLFQRAWVYQERRLSTRILHFGRHQLHWECSSRLLAEDDWEGSELRQYDLKSSKVEEDPEVGWRHVVEHYSRLRLTYEKDRLPAISAFVKRMQRVRQDDVYIAGMWKKTLQHDLCWFSDGEELLPRPHIRGTVMPTWSWISQSGGVYFEDISILLFSPDDINIAYNITGPAHVGQVSHASIQLKARFMFVKPKLTAKSPFVTFEHPDGIWGNDGPLMKSYESGWDFDYTTADPPIHTHETFVLLLLSKVCLYGYFGMVLRELANKQFERVGYVQLYGSTLALEPITAKRLREGIVSLPIRQFTIV